MKTFLPTLVFCFLVVFGSNAQFNQIELRFFDSNTGLAVTPESVQITDLSDNSTALELNERTLGERTPYDLDLTKLKPSGYSIYVDKKGYAPMGTYIESDNASIGYVNFYLENYSPPKELSGATITKKQRVNETLIVGYTADENGKPIANVSITSNDKRFQTTSDQTGYFEAYLPVNIDNEKVSLSFKKNGFETHLRENVMLWSKGSWTFQIKLAPGTGVNRQADRRSAASSPQIKEGFKDSNLKYPNLHTSYVNSMKLACLPTQIRVGTGCSCSSCGGVDVHTVQNYVKRVLPHEWIVSWANWNGGLGINSLRAGSVSIRSYSSWFAFNPINSSYDICSTTCCQVYQNSTNAQASAAVDATDGWAVTYTNGNVARSEYSAENNDFSPTTSCGNNYTGPNTTGTNCIYDPVCSGRARFGHGRGMCQWGTARWAAGWTNGSGTTHSYGTKSWQDIVTHYYPDYIFQNCGCAPNQTLSGTLSGSNVIVAGLTINTTNVIPNGASADITAGTYVQMNPGFDAQTGAILDAYIQGCTNFNKQANPTSPTPTIQEAPAAGPGPQPIKD